MLVHTLDVKADLDILYKQVTTIVCSADAGPRERCSGAAALSADC